MKKISVYDDKSISFGIKNVKYVIGDNVVKHYIWKNFHKTFKKVDDSEYQVENNIRKLLYVNDELINTRLTKYYEVTDMFNAQQELKLTSRSILRDYFLSLYEKVEYSETLNTINLLFESLEEELEEKLTFNNIKINIKNIDLKELIKLIEPKFIIEDHYASMYDLNYEQLILFQIKMIKTIAEIQSYEYYVIADITYVTEKIKEELENVPNNLKIIVFTNSNLKTNIKNILSVENKVVDFADDITLYNEIVMNYPKSITLDELKDKLSKYIEDKGSDEFKDLKKLL